MNYYLKALKNYATFSGRATRSEYWYFVLFSVIISIILTLIGTFLLGFPGLRYIYSLAVLIPSIAIGVRRMHDVDKSGWYLLIPIYSLILACTKGTIGENEYGEDPNGGKEFGAADYQKPLEAGN